MHEKQFRNFLSSILGDNKSLHNCSEKIKFLAFSDYQRKKPPDDIFLVYEDWWIRHPEIIKGKIKSICGESKRIYARKCSVRKLESPCAEDFYRKNHIYGPAKAKHHYALLQDNEIAAAISFAGIRIFERGKSGELIRFCNRAGSLVVGGLSKLIKHYTLAYTPDDIMTYIDPDWGSGKGFENIGFRKIGFRKPVGFLCHPETGERIPEKYFDNSENRGNYYKLQNRGSYKMILYLKNSGIWL